MDLSIIDNQNLENPILIEFKYQFTNDFKELKDYKYVVNKDFEIRKSDMFILIISNWSNDDKKSFDNNWGVTSNLSRYISKNTNWKENIESVLNSFNQTNLEIFDKIIIDKPYQAEYYIYNLKRK